MKKPGEQKHCWLEQAEMSPGDELLPLSDQAIQFCRLSDTENEAQISGLQVPKRSMSALPAK